MHDFKSLIKTYDSSLDDDFCKKLIHAFEENSRFHTENGKSMRHTLSESRWIEMDVGEHADDAFQGFFFHKIQEALQRYNNDLPYSIKIPLRPDIDRLIIKKYHPGNTDKFQLHFDSIDKSSGRYLVFLWYLNDVEIGGETEFPDFNVKISPKTGRLLIFPPYWMFQHKGNAPISCEKYIISTYLTFK